MSDIRRITGESSGELALDSVRTTFAWLVTGPDPVSVDGRPLPEVPERAVVVDELRDLLLGQRMSLAARDAVWRELLARARAEGGTWTVVCAGMALPALAATAARLSTGRGHDREDVHAAVLAGFLTALATIDPHRPNLAGRLRWAAHRAGLAVLAARADAPTPDADQFRSAAPRPPWGHPDLVLARAVADGVLTPIEADLIGETRIGGMRLAAWSTRNHTGLEATYRARKRAERRLVAYLRDNPADPDDPTHTEALRRPRRRPTPSATSSAAGAGEGTGSGRSGVRGSRRLALSGRRRNGDPAEQRGPVTRGDHDRRGDGKRGKKPARAVSKTAPESGFLPCGTTPPPAEPEVPRCA